MKSLSRYSPIYKKNFYFSTKLFIKIYLTLLIGISQGCFLTSYAYGEDSFLMEDEEDLTWLKEYERDSAPKESPAELLSEAEKLLYRFEKIRIKLSSLKPRSDSRFIIEPFVRELHAWFLRARASGFLPESIKSSLFVEQSVIKQISNFIETRRPEDEIPMEISYYSIIPHMECEVRIIIEYLKHEITN